MRDDRAISSVKRHTAYSAITSSRTLWGKRADAAAKDLDPATVNSWVAQDPRNSTLHRLLLSKKKSTSSNGLCGQPIPDKMLMCTIVGIVVEQSTIAGSPSRRFHWREGFINADVPNVRQASAHTFDVCLNPGTISLHLPTSIHRAPVPNVWMMKKAYSSNEIM
ncbi:hypothetical protein SeMB42_g05997 [Synchytrium endobioticum]|uniref:Uncharacterized protein n=1 Tax=Synchytrium endobioticum TaxID=286115 RepID=A0A507CL71_9FUNG|nr:hypothetical protein SeMB42_g05997 [Synchytrium endobioticum]